MTAHTCTVLTDGCYRCDLSRDEIRGWAETLVVTRKAVVHDPDCTFVSGITSTATKWLPVPARNDRACSRCLPDGLPNVRTPSVELERRPDAPTGRASELEGGSDV